MSPEFTNETGPFYHGTKAQLAVGDLLAAGYGYNYEAGRTANFIYFAATLEAAIWGAELAAGEGAGHVYIVEPTGDFHDDPNLTDKRFPGNPTRSYRSQEALRVVAEVIGWVGHPSQQVQAMKDGIAKIMANGGEILD